MDRIIVDDKASALYAVQLKERLDALEQSGMGKDEDGNVVTVSADQVVTTGTEIGGITIGGTRTAFYAPEVSVPEAEKVTVTPLVNNGTKIANIKVGNNLQSIYAPSTEAVTVTPELNNGTKIATIKVGNKTSTLYAPEIINDGSGATIDLSGKLDVPAVAGTNGQVLATDGNGNNYWTTVEGGGETIIHTEGGDGPLPLLKDIVLTENVSSVVITSDDAGNPLNLTDAFYIEAEFKTTSDNQARYFTVSIGTTANETNIPFMSTHTINTDRATYADVYAKQIAPKQWKVEARSKTTMYETPTSLGTGIGQLGYDNWNGLNNPLTAISRINISFSTANVGKNTKIKLYGR